MPDTLVVSTIETPGKQIGHLHLNVPKALNSLSLEMIEGMMGQLGEWAADDDIAAVLIDGEGDRAFCAGGDIQALHASTAEVPGGRAPYAERFFEMEYRLDYQIHTYSKPVVCWGNGIVMGGGLGIMSASSHGIASETSRLAMPEISIGLFPDAGTTWFLAHMPAHLAHFIALTGCHLNGEDARLVGMVNHLVSSGDEPRLMASLAAVELTGDRVLDDGLLRGAIDGCSRDDMPPSELDRHNELVRTLVDVALVADDPVAAFADAAAGLSDVDAWTERALGGFWNGCPTTAGIIFEQIARARLMTLEETLQMEFCLGCQCAWRLDFTEGVRALLIDKDGNADWQYPDHRAVPHDWVLAHFQIDVANPLADLG